jgi:hypothetical protein
MIKRRNIVKMAEIKQHIREKMLQMVEVLLGYVTYDSYNDEDNGVTNVVRLLLSMIELVDNTSDISNLGQVLAFEVEGAAHYMLEGTINGVVQKYYLKDDVYRKNIPWLQKSIHENFLEMIQVINMNTDGDMTTRASSCVVATPDVKPFLDDMQDYVRKKTYTKITDTYNEPLHYSVDPADLDFSISIDAPAVGPALRKFIKNLWKPNMQQLERLKDRLVVGPSPGYSSYAETAIRNAYDRIIKKHGIKAHICLGDSPELLKYAPTIAKEKGILYYGEGEGLSIVDFKVPTMHQMKKVKKLLTMLLTAMPGGDKVYLSCGAGIGRSGTVVNAVLAQHKKFKSQNEVHDFAANTLKIKGYQFPETEDQKISIDALIQSLIKIV